jgi:serine phosphatase RsbU (regulator of sigma subunit)
MAGRSVPARDVGGDFFDGLRMADGRWLAVLGDVSGKGMPAALLMATTRMVLRTAARDAADLITLLGRASEQLGQELDEYFFVTVQAVAIDAETGLATFASAGHGPLAARLGGRVRLIENEGGPPLGIGGLVGGYHETRFQLTPGDILLFYTDGLSEERSPTGEMFGNERVMQLLADLPSSEPRPALERVFAAADQWRQGGEAHDDLTVLVLAYQESRP